VDRGAIDQRRDSNVADVTSSDSEQRDDTPDASEKNDDLEDEKEMAETEAGDDGAKDGRQDNNDAADKSDDNDDGNDESDGTEQQPEGRLASTTTLPQNCPIGWETWNEGCYKVNPYTSSYSDAQMWCGFHNARLVAINSFAENAFVFRLCGLTGSCWLGLTEKPFTGGKLTTPAKQEWVWSDGTTPASNNYMQWNGYGTDHGEPDNGRGSFDERNAVIRSGLWFDEQPELPARAVCETTAQQAMMASTTMTIVHPASVPAVAPLFTTATTTSTTSTATTTTDSCPSSCYALSGSHGWPLACDAASCGECEACVGVEAGPCPLGWMTFNGKCYRIRVDNATDYFTAESWCTSQGAQLVSINTVQENEFIWRICGVGTGDPLRQPYQLRQASCWLGLTEKPGTGSLDTPQQDQVWTWADGTRLNMDGWQQYCYFCDGEHDERHKEPNNGRTPFEHDTHNHDERYAVMNRLDGDRDGKWYDQPPEHTAHAICEMEMAPPPAKFLQRANSRQGGEHQVTFRSLRPVRMRGSHVINTLSRALTIM